MKPRLMTFDEDKWQSLFFKECNIDLDDVSENNQSDNRYYRDRRVEDEEKEFMNEIAHKDLRQSYFSSHSISEAVYQERVGFYNQWKMKKI